MDTNTFLANFGHLADAPNGVRKLRELILQLAVQGKLVPQDPKDEPAAKLLARIRKEKAGRRGGFQTRPVLRASRAEKEGQQSGAGLEPAPTEMPYELPQGWEWTRLENIGLVSPSNCLDDDLDVAFVPMALISEKYGEPVKLEVRKWSEVKKGFTHFAEGDVALAKITPCFQNGKSAVMRGLKNGVGAGTTELHVFRSLGGTISPEYVLAYLKSPAFVNNGIPIMTGSAGQKRVPREYFSQNPFPLPPLAEQHRIVAKVDQLMALCDELEARQQKQQEGRVRLNNAALDALLNAGDPADFAVHWQRICANFDLLYDHPDTIAKLRAAILQLAVQGKLVPQDPRDEPTEVLLGRIRKTKTSKKAVWPAVKSGETPYPLPHGWEWVRLGELGYFLGGGTPSKHNPAFWFGEIPWVSPKDMKTKYIADAIDHISSEAIQKSAAKLIPVGSVLMVLRGMILLHSFPVAKTTVEVTINQDMKALVCALSDISEYVLLSLTGEKGRILQLVERSSHGTCRLDSGDISAFVVGLPPLAEQNRIVAKVDQLMALCDDLEVKLNQARQQSEKLMEANVRQLVVA